MIIFPNAWGADRCTCIHASDELFAEKEVTTQLI